MRKAWTVEYDDQDEYFTILDNDGSTLIATIAASVIEDDGEPSADDYKLARLIAEAPAMAEALEVLLRQVTWDGTEADNARAILARIKGATP